MNPPILRENRGGERGKGRGSAGDAIIDHSDGTNEIEKIRIVISLFE